MALSVTDLTTAPTSCERPQRYDLYSCRDHETWRALFERIEPYWARYASGRFLDGVERLELDRAAIPRLAEVNERLRPLTGFRAAGAPGYLPAGDFFRCLSERVFPTSVTIRDLDRLDYLPEPDIFHDVAGHVPMHTDPLFAEALARFGRLAERRDIGALARIFWFTVEFGLIHENGELKAYGSGLMSSVGELRHAVESPDVERLPFRLDRVARQPFEIDHFQPVLFVIESFEQLFEAIGELEGSPPRPAPAVG